MPRNAKAAQALPKQLVSYRPLAPDYSVGGQASRQSRWRLSALISGKNQTGEQNADVAATTVPSRAPRESQMEPSIEPCMLPLLKSGVG